MQNNDRARSQMTIWIVMGYGGISRKYDVHKLWLIPKIHGPFTLKGNFCLKKDFFCIASALNWINIFFPNFLLLGLIKEKFLDCIFVTTFLVSQPGVNGGWPPDSYTPSGHQTSYFLTNLKSLTECVIKEKE